MPQSQAAALTTATCVSVAALGCGYLVYRALSTKQEKMAKTHLMEDMEHQVGGHACAKTSLKLYNGRVLKPFQSKNRGETELAFYEHVLPLRLPFLPAFFGVLELQADDDSSDLRRYLQLEDLLHGMTKPCIMDVKIGTKSYEPNASADKMALEAAKSPLQAIVGFRLQGIKVYCDGGYVSLDKHYMRTLSTLDEVVDGGFR
ncbi:hypothetical protein As57867_006823, partial [Aphanomyces stellatus]